MKYYKINKSLLKFTEMNQINRKWKYPILIDSNYEVYLGNSLKNSLSDKVIVIILEENKVLKDDLIYIESKIVEENSEKRINLIESEVNEYLRELKKESHKNENLFFYEDKGLITEENYIKMINDFRKHNGKSSSEEEPDSESEFEIDYEIMKELL